MPHRFKFKILNSPRMRIARRWAGALLVLAGIAFAGQAAAQKSRPLSVRDVTDLLKGSVPNSEIARLVTENGISFRMTGELETQFREAGAADELITALQKASKPEEAPPPAPSAGMLKIQSQPGEAQVYVNDEPKGITSPAGELRLSGMAPGDYRLRVSLGGYKTWENSITVTAGETVTAFVTLEKQNLAPMVTLEADRVSIARGQSVTLKWTSANATDVDIEPGVGKVALAGITSVTPRESTTYTLTAIGPGGIKTATSTVSVAAPATVPVPVVPPVVGNLPGFPVPGASFKEIKFFESGATIPPNGSRTYQPQFNHRATRFVDWELHITCPPVPYRVNFTIYATWYYPDGAVFGNETVNTFAEPGWTEPTYTSGRGWQRIGMWKRGTYRVDLTVNGSRIGSGSFTIF